MPAELKSTSQGRTMVLVIMLQTAAQLQLFGQSQLMTAGGPSGASRTATRSKATWIRERRA